MVEVLEPRVLYSADSVASLLPLLLPDELDTAEALGSSRLFDIHSPIDENDLLPGMVAETGTIKHVVFIDAAVPEFETLRKATSSEYTSVVIIDTETNGLSVISQTLEHFTSLDSIQIISHGVSGQLFLGNQSVDEQVLINEQSALEGWSNALSEEGDILLLGCDVGAGEAGKHFVQQLAVLTGADVAASDDLTGHAKFNADWQLEVSSGSIETTLLLDAETQNIWVHKLGDIEVDTLTDKFSTAIQDTWGLGGLISYQSANPGFEVSLREALYVAQNFPDTDTITLPGGTFSLTLSSGTADGKWGDLNVSEDTIIVGENNPANPTVINQTVANQRIITGSGGSLQLESVTISNADTSLVDGGGAIFSAGSVVLIDTVLANNSSTENGGAIATVGDLTLLRTQVSGNISDKLGGALYSEGQLNINASQFTGNQSLDDGGAVFAFGQTLNINDSGFSGNFTDTADASGMTGNGGALAGTADIIINRSSFDGNETRNVNLFSTGGAVHHEGSGSVIISDVTFSGNSSVSGGAVYTDQGGVITNATFVDNTAVLNGAALQSDGAVLSIGSSLFSGNDFVSPAAVGSTHLVSASQHVIAGNVTSEGFNLYDFNPSPGVLLGTGDLVNTVAGAVSAQLNPLSMPIGGYVKAHTLQDGSQAINAGRVSSQAAEDSQGLRRDQVSDIGASEQNSTSSIVFFSDAGGGIYRSDAEFSNVQQIVFGTANPESIKVDETESKIYWLSNSGASVDLMSASLDGMGGETTLLSNLLAASSLAINSAAGHLYIAFAGNSPRIDKYDLQDLLAAPVTVVANNSGILTPIDQNEILLNPIELVFNSTTEQLLWSEQDAGNVFASLRTFDVATNTMSVRAGVVDSLTVNPEGSSVFWTDTTANTISEFDSDSSTLTQTAVAVADSNPADIAYAKTEDLLVWISDGASSISSLDVKDKTVQSRYEHGSALTDVATMRTSSVTAIPEITTNSSMSVPEGSARLLPKTNLIASDADSASRDIVYTVTRVPLHGYLTLSGVPTSSFTQFDLQFDRVNYIHNGTETSNDQIEFQLSDGINESDRFKYDIVITPVNDAPTLRVATDALGVPLKMPLAEGGVSVLDSALLIGFDAETAPAALVYHLESAVTFGRFIVDGVEATTFTGSQLNAGQVQFEHDGSENAPASLHIKLLDGNAADGESGTVILDFDFVLVNDPPVLTTTATTVFENASVVITNQNLRITDPDLGFDNVVYKLAEMPSHGTVEVLNRGPLLSTAATFTQVELNNGWVSYTPSVNNANDATYQLVFVATDPQGESSGAVPMDVMVTGINNTPTLTTLPLAIVEGSQVILTGANFIVDDPDSSSGDWILSFRDTAQMHGTISIFNQTGEPANDGYRYFSYRDLLIGNVVYNHDGSESDSAEILFRVGDGISTSAAVPLRLSIAPVNDVPSLRVSNNMITVDEGGEYVFRSTDLSFTDADAVFENMRIFFSKVSDTSSGVITVAGESATSFNLAELADGQVVYSHDGSEPDITGMTDSFSFGISDSQSESSLVVLTIGIEPQNDLPEFSFVPTAQPIQENTPGKVVGEINYTDADTGDTVVFSVSDDRFVLTPINQNTVQLALGESDTLDFEEDARFEGGMMRLEITALDSNPDVQRPVGYQGLQQEENLPVSDINDAPFINSEAVLTVVPGPGYTFDSSWVVDQDDSIEELVFSALLVDGSELPAWLAFNAQSRSFEVLEPESPALIDLDIIIKVVDAAGSESTVPVSLLFNALTDPAPAQPVVEPVVTPEEPQEEIVETEPEQVESTIESDVDLATLLTAPIVAPPSSTVSVLPESLSALEEADDSDDAEAKRTADEEARNKELNEVVDLHDLIKPLASIGTLQLAVIDTAVGALAENSGGSQLNQDMDMRNLTDIFSAAQAEMEAQSLLMANAMDNKEVAQDERSAASRALFGTSTGLSTGLSVGYLIWLVRGGTLMGSVLSSLPAWRFVDPLPVLGSLADDMENDEESLESIVENEGKGGPVEQSVAAPSIVMKVASAFGWKR